MSKKTVIKINVIDGFYAEGLAIKAFNISEVGRAVNPSVNRHVKEELTEAEGVFVISDLDALMHGEEFLALVEFCYDYKFELQITGERKNAIDHLHSLLVAKRHMTQGNALYTINRLFPMKDDKERDFVYNT